MNDPINPWLTVAATGTVRDKDGNIRTEAPASEIEGQSR